MSFRVTAVVVFDTQVVPIDGGSGSGNSEPTALVSSFPVPGAVTTMSYGNAADVRLRPGATVAGLTRAATALAQRYKDTAGQILTISEADQVAATQQAIRPQAIALAAFAALAGLIALAVIGQLLSRQLALDSAEFPVLRAIGATRGSLVALSLARLAVVTLAGGVIAVAVAIAASPLMPIGPARLAEPHPGVEVNLAILGAGFAAIALLPLALLAGAAWRAARAAGRWPGPLGVAEPAQPGRRSRIGGALTCSGPVTGGVGVAMAFEPGHGRTAVPVRSALAASVIAVIALTAAAVFGTSLVALVSTPHDYGQNWDAQLDLEFGGAPGTIGARVIIGRARGDRVRVWHLRPARDRRPDRARDRRGPAAGRRLPDDAGRPAAGRRRRDRPRRPDAARPARPTRPDRSRSPSSSLRPACPSCGATCASPGWPCCPPSAAARSRPPTWVPGP